MPSSRESDAVSWVLTCLEDSRLDYTMSGIQYAWNVVSNILNELETAIIDEDGFASDPEIVVAIRVGHARSPYMYHTCDEDDLVEAARAQESAGRGFVEIVELRRDVVRVWQDSKPGFG